MLCFEVKVNGQVICTAGIGDFGVLSAILSWANTQPSGRQYEEPDMEQKEDLFLSVGGLTSREKGDNIPVNWLYQALRRGDEVNIRIVDQPTCDPPIKPDEGDEVLNRENVYRLRAGMTKDEVEAILGPHSGQKVRHEEPQYAWIGKGVMLRARFFGPNLTLTKAIWDTPEKSEIIVPSECRYD